MYYPQLKEYQILKSTILFNLISSFKEHIIIEQILIHKKVNFL